MRKQKLNILQAIFNLRRSGADISHYNNARKLIELKIELRKLGADIFLVCLGILSAGFGLESFLLPNNFLDGGATGISPLISELSGISLSILIVLVNIVIFFVAAYFFSMETVLYAMLTYLSASKTVYFILEGIEEYTGVTIISIKVDRIRNMITSKLGRGITVYKGERGFGKSGEKLYNMKIIYTIITRQAGSK